MSSDLNIQMVLSAKDEASKVVNQVTDSLVKVEKEAANSLDKVQESLNKISTAKVDSIADSFKELGIKSSAAMDEMREKINKSYQDIVNHANSTANDIIRAEKAKTEQLNRLNDEQFNHVKENISDMSATVSNSGSGMSSIFDGLTTALKGLAVAAIAYKAIDIGKSFVDAGLSAEKLSTAMKSATGSYNEAESAMSFLRAESERLGTDLVSSTDGFIKLTAAAKGTSLEGEKTRDIFTAISEASAALKLSNDETSGVILALSQMMSKGTVQAEELRGQLGERLPGAFNIAAKAMGVTTEELGKMLEKGQVVAADFLPKFANALKNEYGAAATDAASSTQAAVNRMNNAWEDAKRTIGESLLPAIADAAVKINAFIKSIAPERLSGVERLSELNTKIANLQDRMTQPGMTWVLNDELVKAQKEAKTLEYSLAGVTSATGQWAKGMRDLNSAETNLLFNGKDGWLKYKEGVENAAKTSAYDQIKNKTLDVTKQTELLTEQLKNSETYQTILAAKGVEAADKWVAASVKAETHHEKASSSMKEAKKSAEEYNNTIQNVVDKYNQLTMSADDYARAKVWETYQKEAAVLGENNEYLLAARDLALKKIETDGEQAKAIKEVNDKYNELFLTTEQLEQVKLQDWFDKLKEKIGDNKEALEKLNLEFAAMRAKILYGDEKDIWVDFYKGKEDANERANKLISEQDKKAAESVNKIWDKAWKNIESDFADTIYDMMDKGVDSFGDFFDKIGDMFKKLLAEMVAAWIVSGLKTLLSGGEGAFSLAGLFGGSSSGSSPADTASSALSLASLLKSIADLPETIMSIPDKFMSGLEAVGEALGLVESSATASSAAAAHAASSTAGASAAMESLASSAGAAAEGNVYLAGTVDDLVESYLAEQAAASAAASANLAGALTGAGIASIIAFGANILPGLIGGGNDDIDIMYELKKFEQGYTNITKETADLYKVMALNIDETMTKISDSGMVTYDWDKIDAWIASNQEFLNITVAEIEKLIAQQTDVGTKLVDAGVVLSQNTFLNEEAHAKATIDVAIEIAKDETMSVAQKMYQLGFIAKESGGWESEATMAMIAEFKNQGVAWQDINNALINYGATDADVYKRIYAEYHGDSVLTDLNTLTAALTADGVSEDVLKTIKYIYESNIPLDQMQALLEWAGLSSEEAARIVGQIDPSDQWKDLVIPVDAPDSIPVDYGSQEGRATGGPVAGGVPYIIGERGPELFVPQQSGHILSNDNMKKLMGMGIKGYADGTTDPLPGTPEWWEQHPPSDQDINGSSSSDTSTYKTLSEWLDDYNEKLKELLGTGNDLSDQLDELNKYYEEQNKYASELNASSEQIAQLQEDQQKAKEKILQDWLNEEIDYYNQMMGLNTDLGDTLKEISSHYDTAIAEATSAGATEEQLAEIRKAQMAVTEKALKDWLNDEIDYYNDAMGISTQYGNVLKEISDHYEKAIAEAKAAGATEEQLAEIRKAQMAVTEKATKDWAKSTMSSLMDVWESMLEWAQEIAGATEQQMALTKLMIYRAKQGFSAKGFEDILNIDGMNSDQVEEYVDKLAEYANAVISALQATYDALKTVREAIDQNIQDILDESKTSEQLANEYAQQIIAGWNALSGLSAEDMPEAIDDLREKIMKYYELQKKLIEDKYKAEEEKFQDEIESIEKIRDKIQELAYSNFNIASPKDKVTTAAGDYAALLAAAKTGDKDAIEKYLAFINEYLQAAQDAYKSSDKYLEIYNQVMKDLKSLDTQQGKTIEDLTEELNKLTAENTKKMQEELDALAKLTVDALKALGEKTDATMNDVVTQLKNIFDLLTAWVTAIYGGGKTQSASSAGYADGGIASGPYSGYTATLHGTEAIIPLRSGSVPVVISGGGYDDPETKALLKQLVAQGKSKQKVTLILEDGSELKAYVRREADSVRVSAASRKGSETRRLYQ